jgi:hypothetical protein
MVFLYSDVLYRTGGIETYLHALALHLKRERIPTCVAVWLMRQRAMMAWLSLQLTSNDWVFGHSLF